MSTSTKTRDLPSGEVLFTLRNNRITFNGNLNNSANEEIETENIIDDSVENEDPPNSILCVLWKNSRMGAAYYKISDQQLYVFQETIDLAPEFLATKSLYREVNPLHIVTIGTPCDAFVQQLINIASKVEGNNSTTNSVQTTTLPSNLSLLHFKDSSFEVCEYKILNISLPGEPENATQTQRALFLHSLVDFNSKLSVHALGALIKFTEKNWSHLNPDEPLRFLHINQNSLSRHLFMDRNTFNGLNVFQIRTHDASFQHGRQSANREGHSIFKLLSQHCKSKLGYSCLKNILTNPICNMGELNKRLDFIQFAMVAGNQGFIESLQDNIRKICDINVILRKIQYSRATNRDWEMLYKTIYHTLYLHELCVSHRAASALLSALDLSISAKLYDLQSLICKSLDFSLQYKRSRPAIKFGTDNELDAKELRKQDIAKNITTAAKFTVNHLPDYLNECSVVHIPEMGHLVAVKEWEPDCDQNQLHDSGFQFMFKINGLLHYKNAMCVELDRQLGNIHHEILAHENRIIQRVSDFVLRYNKDIREPLKIIALIDCLISMSHVAKANDYVRATLNENGVHEIEDGRHPLLELISSNFVPNDYHSGTPHTHMKILTGPNNSGKSVYLKQIALLIYLAHVGSYIPAKKANIAIVHSIHSRIHTMESASVSLSAFMLDLSQMSQALNNAKATSLVLLDEFGRGTTGNEGIALLTAALQKFSSHQRLCPHVLVSTHLQEICEYLPESQIISHLKMDHTHSTNLIFLYKAMEGISTSFAFEAAEAAGLDCNIISRARAIFQALYRNETILTSCSGDKDEVDLLDIKIPEPDD